MNIYDKAILGWKEDREYYKLSKEDRHQKYQDLICKYFTQPEIDKYYKEFSESDAWNNLYKNRVEGLASSRQSLSMFYSLIRKLKPNIILETGVQRGCTTTIFLHALKVNNKGHLISIDYCKEHPEQIAMYVPKNLKDRWTFYKGKTKDILPTLDVKVDLFYHDSEHSYNNMYYEYQWAWKHLKKDGLLTSHDIGANNAFFDFVHNYNLDYYFLNAYSPGGYGAGVIIKNDAKLIDAPIERKRPKPKPKPKIKEFNRSNFQYGLNFVERCKREVYGLKIKIVPGRGGIDEPVIFYNNKKIVQISPRAYCRFGGIINGKSFRVENEEDENQLLNEIKKQISIKNIEVSHDQH